MSKTCALHTSLNKLQVFVQFDCLILNFCVSTGENQCIAVKIKAKWVGFNNFIAYGYRGKQLAWFCKRYLRYNWMIFCRRESFVHNG